jgi:hypothetical protein
MVHSTVPARNQAAQDDGPLLILVAHYVNMLAFTDLAVGSGQGGADGAMRVVERLDFDGGKAGR